MSSASRIFTEDQRLCVLKTLEESPGYKANEGVIQATLSIYGHQVSRDKVKGLCAWLDEAELVDIETLNSDIRIISITPRGQEVANGLAIHPGVKRPRPK